MLPIFLQELLSAFRLFNFCVKKWGKCCPFFCENFLQIFDLCISRQLQGKMLPVFLQEFFTEISIVQFSC